MFFLFPFAGEPAAVPASQRTRRHKALPLQPQAHGARARTQPENGFADAFSLARSLAAELLKRALSSMTSSLTALGNYANALFCQIAAALAYERIARETASFFGAFWPGFAQPKPQVGFAGPWFPSAAAPPLACFGLAGRQPAPYLPNPWGTHTEALGIWTSLWMPTTSLRGRASHTR